MNKVRSVLVDNLGLYSFMARSGKPEATIGYDTNDHAAAKQAVEDFDKLITACKTLQKAYAFAPDQNMRAEIAEALGLPKGCGYTIRKLRIKANQHFQQLLSEYN